MIDNLKKILNEDQDPKAVEKIAEKLTDILMQKEEVGYIAVQKKPAITVLPDSVVLTNKRVIICKPKNLGLSMQLTDYDWEDIVAPFIKENLLGAEFSFMTKNDMAVSVDYLPKNQARKLFTFAKEQLDERKHLLTKSIDNLADAVQVYEAEIDETLTEEVPFEALPVPEPQSVLQLEEQAKALDIIIEENPVVIDKEKKLADLTKEELFEKLLNYKKLLDHGLILQTEYDALKTEIIKYM